MAGKIASQAGAINPRRLPYRSTWVKSLKKRLVLVHAVRRIGALVCYNYYLILIRKGNNHTTWPLPPKS